MNLFRWMKSALAGSWQPVVHIPDTPHTGPVRRRYCFSGLVQGVGFRYEAMMIANQLQLTGWAQNKRDGTVVIEIEGEPSYIDEFLRVMQEVPRFDITGIQTEMIPLSASETTFDARY